jgi:hypothetical protein
MDFGSEIDSYTRALELRRRVALETRSRERRTRGVPAGDSAPNLSTRVPYSRDARWVPPGVGRRRDRRRRVPPLSLSSREEHYANKFAVDVGALLGGPAHKA